MKPAPEIDRLIQLLARLPGLGPRSARRAALHLLKKPDALMLPLAEALKTTAEAVQPCPVCHTLDVVQPCRICTDPARDAGLICVVEQVGDLWALERSGTFKGRYHVLGGTLSALDGTRPDDLTIASLERRVADGGVREAILALNATVDGQTTAHYVAERLEALGGSEMGASEAGGGITISRLAHGVPVGGELDYLDDGTLAAALASRRRLG